MMKTYRLSSGGHPTALADIGKGRLWSHASLVLLDVAD
jgi:hypothetical protein